MSFQMLNDYEHVLQKIPMYAGSEKHVTTTSYILKDDKILKTEIEVVPAILKLISELIDNSVDEFIRTNGEFANKIDITIKDNMVNVKDNGRGIPVKEVQTYKGLDWQPKLSWTELKAGTNFGKDDTTTIGTFGVGSSLCSVLSREFVGISDDGKNKCTVHCSNNNETITTKISKSTTAGCDVTMKIDMNRFANGKLDIIDDNHLMMVKQRLINLSLTYPDIIFTLNKQKIKVNDKLFLSYFGEGISEKTDNITLGLFTSETDDFQQFSLINGLTISDGGNHVDYIIDNIVNGIREKLIKKYKTIKPGDIRNRLKLVLIMKNFNRPEYNSQTKEKLTNDKKDIANYFKEIDFAKLTNKILKTPEIIDPITEVYKIKEELKKRQEMKGLDKTVKKIKSDKYTKPIGSNDVLLICEGLSAKSALLPGLGRQGLGYYELKGKPANVYASDQKKFTENKELSELYKIIKQEGYKKIAVASDSDLDGIAINGLLIAFFKRYLQEELEAGMLYRLNTPVMALLDKNKLPKEWIYDLAGTLKEKSGLTFKYFKGLGSWTPVQMKEVIEKDGINNMLVQISYTEYDDETIDDWYSDKKADKRKEYIINNDFDLIKL